MAAAVTLPNTIVDGTANDAARPMANWNALVTWINTNAVHLDGTKAMTGTLAGPAGVDPVGANDYSRKAYVDTQDAAEVTARNAAIAAQVALLPIRHGFYTQGGYLSSNSTNTVITTGSTEVTDTDSYAAAPSPSMTVPAGRAGFYTISGLFVPGGAASHTIHMLYNGGTIMGYADTSPSSYKAFNLTMFLNVGDTVVWRFTSNGVDPVTYYIAYVQLSK